MFLIPCPWCGPRDQSEFSCGGEARVARPVDSLGLGDDEWADYLFMRSNPKGPFAERWVHSAGCGRWFELVRDAADDRIIGARKAGETVPSAEESGTSAGERPA